MNKFFALMFLVFSAMLIAQDTNKVVTDEKTGNPMLIGFVTREAVEDTTFSPEFKSEYESYDLNYPVLDKLEEFAYGTDITVIMGTWCGDSKIEVPRFLKILDELNFPEEDLKIISVNRDKITENDELEGLEIDWVPTIIFYRDGVELGRIVEMPEESLEEDMLRIIGEEQS